MQGDKRFVVEAPFLTCCCSQPRFRSNDHDDVHSFLREVSRTGALFGGGSWVRVANQLDG